MSILHRRAYCGVNIHRVAESIIDCSRRETDTTHPVRIRVPGLSVVPCDKKEIMRGMLKIRSLPNTIERESSAHDFCRCIYTAKQVDSLKTTVLYNGPIMNALDPHRLHVPDLVFVDDRWSDRTCSVEALGITPLALLKLRLAGRNVIVGGVREKIV